MLYYYVIEKKKDLDTRVSVNSSGLYTSIIISVMHWKYLVTYANSTFVMSICFSLIYSLFFKISFQYSLTMVLTKERKFTWMISSFNNVFKSFALWYKKILMLLTYKNKESFVNNRVVLNVKHNGRVWHQLIL